MGQAARALVVDDDDPIRMMLATVVAQQGFSVETAKDGAEAIDRLRVGDDYDLILLDIMMPRVDGYAVLRHIKTINPELLQRTIIASALPEAEIRSKVSDDVYKVHVKPFDLSRLIADIRDKAA